MTVCVCVCTIVTPFQRNFYGIYIAIFEINRAWLAMVIIAKSATEYVASHKASIRSVLILAELKALTCGI